MKNRGKKNSNLRPGIYMKAYRLNERTYYESRKLQRITVNDGRREVEYTKPDPDPRLSEHIYVCSVREWREWVAGAEYL